MAVVEIRDHALWIKHIEGDPGLCASLSELPPGASAWLDVGGASGEWLKMASGPSGKPTPGLRPSENVKAAWRELQQLRGSKVAIKRLETPSVLPQTTEDSASLRAHNYAPTPIEAPHLGPNTACRRIPLPEPVARIYAAVEELEAACPGRKFTPDGHLVGSIGEVVAAEALGLTLYPGSFPGHDAVDARGRQVQIKLTRGKSIPLYACCERLVVLRITSPHEAEIVYDGDGALAWALAGPLQKNGQRVVRLAKLANAAALELAT